METDEGICTVLACLYVCGSWYWRG